MSNEVKQTYPFTYEYRGCHIYHDQRLPAGANAWRVRINGAYSFRHSLAECTALVDRQYGE